MTEHLPEKDALFDLGLKLVFWSTGILLSLSVEAVSILTREIPR